MSEVDGNAVLRAEQQIIDEKRKKAEEGAKKPGPFDQSQVTTAETPRGRGLFFHLHSPRTDLFHSSLFSG